MKPKVRDTLNRIIHRFETGEIPEAVAVSMFPFPDVPSARWSLTNRTLMFLSGSMDARGIRQWNSVNRYVKRGTKAMYILIPYLKEVEDDLGEQRHSLMGFGVGPVFRVEDTEGDPLEYEDIKVPDFPLIERANDLGIDVRAIPGNYKYFGYYSPGRKEIAVATSSECVFFHELAHTAHHIIKGNLRAGQDPLQEIVAELSAQALALMVGKSAEDYAGNGYRYIEKYAKEAGMKVHTACLKVLAETEKVLNLILTGQVIGKNEYKMVA
jgi:hypothetical protein